MRQNKGPSAENEQAAINWPRIRRGIPRPIDYSYPKFSFYVSPLVPHPGRSVGSRLGRGDVWQQQCSALERSEKNDLLAAMDLRQDYRLRQYTDMASEMTLLKVTPVDGVRQVLNAVEAGRDEVVYDMTQQVKAGLSDEPGIYLNFDPQSAVPAASTN
jgi:hypothetical protein